MTGRPGVFKNLSVAAKLFGGFSVLVGIIIIASAININQLSAISEHSDKEQLVNQISNDLNNARRNRLIYQLTHEDKAAQANLTAINKMADKIKEGDKFTWEKDAGLLFQGLSAKVKEYSDARSNFIGLESASIEQGKKVLEAARQSVFDEAASALRNSESLSKSSVNLLYFIEKARADAGVIVSSRGTDGLQQLRADAQQALSSLAAIKTENTSAVAGSADTLQSALNTLASAADAYSLALKNAKAGADNMTAVADKLNNATAELAQLQADKSSAKIEHVMYIVAIVALFSVVIGLFIAWLITRQMTSQIRYNLNVAERIAAGDLTTVIEADSTDELGRLSAAMATMNQRLRELITQIKESVVYVASASSQISVGNTDLASRTEEQSAAVVETAASMEELTSTVKRNADNAREASTLANTAAQNARSGGQIVWDVVETMQNITDSSNKIKDIITVINGISFQTNILALNAAVEAARAGEQGRGFAVVAGEVRTLASRSAQAAKEIEGLIQESVDRVSSGSAMVNKAGETMKDIVSSVEGVSGIMTEISHASDEQSRGIDQISKAVSELDSTTQQNAALVQESSAAAASLEQQAGELSQLISRFRLGDAIVKKPAAKPVMAPTRTLAADGAGNWETF
ncbi:methyl-accepting chemotaxis protein [Cronobacter turicensis]|uniref:methyl-accepting chemotaxis protein n=1 Tax=Cronobacter turicensis TaxID=413502 RepID=UPI001375CC91|nr:methyl-accepting chemotaxis protein [Cronobacter turicensis]EKM0528764.1 HAMP domain-containing protein [Cronobacter turicensis]ELQ6001874.1 HAMP domain-containing protein [Cronobacter turicensis]ELQ6131131.1 HAMP domain-containing protein [Cronobacter turicensis]ELY3554101.1 HAMP domain-containing protein [Cronobacter turicensis]ELY4524678.1 HAMP domain-containing protein [Cronobacter turicensis]